MTNGHVVIECLRPSWIIQPTPNEHAMTRSSRSCIAQSSRIARDRNPVYPWPAMTHSEYAVNTARIAPATSALERNDAGDAVAPDVGAGVVGDDTDETGHGDVGGDAAIDAGEDDIVDVDRDAVIDGVVMRSEITASTRIHHYLAGKARGPVPTSRVRSGAPSLPPR